MILDVTAYTVMADVYVRINLVPSLGEGSTSDSRRVFERTYSDFAEIPEFERLCRLTRRALIHALIESELSDDTPPF